MVWSGSTRLPLSLLLRPPAPEFVWPPPDAAPVPGWAAPPPPVPPAGAGGTRLASLHRGGRLPWACHRERVRESLQLKPCPDDDAVLR